MCAGAESSDPAVTANHPTAATQRCVVRALGSAPVQCCKCVDGVCARLPLGGEAGALCVPPALAVPIRGLLFRVASEGETRERCPAPPTLSSHPVAPFAVLCMGAGSLRLEPWWPRAGALFPSLVFHVS